MTDRQTDRQNRQTDKQTNRRTDEQMNRRTDEQTDRQTDRQDRQIDKTDKTDNNNECLRVETKQKKQESELNKNKIKHKKSNGQHSFHAAPARLLVPSGSTGQGRHKAVARRGVK